MTRSPLLRWGLGALAVVVLLGVLRAKPWRSSAAVPAAQRETLKVGFLPVT